MPTWRWMGAPGIVVEAGGGDLPSRNEAARDLRDRMTALGLAEVEDVIVGAVSVTVVLARGAEPSPPLRATFEETGISGRPSRAARTHEVDVAYGGELGPDLAEVARIHGILEREVVSLHCSVPYTVGFLGFVPGFAYLIGLPPALATPRLSTPRARVPPGSVAIGGEFTGVYPRATPGGWRIIGRSDVTLFDATLEAPARFAHGDVVRFV